MLTKEKTIVRPLPPLSTLRFFDAAARHMSLRRAAEELHVTHGAVSQRIRGLEEFLGRPVFHRRARQIALTAEGEKLHAATETIFNRLALVVESIRTSLRQETLTVSVGPYFGARWLSPRLERFWNTCPTIDLRLIHPPGAATFRPAEADAGILWGLGNWPGLVSQSLFEVQYQPVCSASLMRRLHRRAGLPLLKAAKLLHTHDRHAWAEWFGAAGLPKQLAEGGQVFEDTNILMEAAVAEQGVALGTRPLVDEDLRAKRLVVAHPQAVPVEETYHFACRPGMLDQPRIRQFRDWLMVEVSLSMPQTKRGP